MYDGIRPSNQRFVYASYIDSNAVGQVHAIGCYMMMQFVVFPLLSRVVDRIRTGFARMQPGIDDATIENAVMMTTTAVVSDVEVDAG